MRGLGKRLLVFSGVTLLAVAFGTLAGPSAGAQGGLGDGTAPDLEGTWRTTVSLLGLPGGDPPPLEDVLHTFARGGTVIITVPLANTTPAHGVWTRVGPRTFGFTAQMFWFDPATGQVAGKTVIKEVIEVDRAGDTYRSVESSAVDYYADGTAVPYHATTHGVRMMVEQPD